MTDLLAILEQIRALPEVSAFQFGFVKGPLGVLPSGAEAYVLVYEWHAMLNGHVYQGASECQRGRDPMESAEAVAETLAEAALASLQKGIADAKRHSEEG